MNKDFEKLVNMVMAGEQPVITIIYRETKTEGISLGRVSRETIPQTKVYKKITGWKSSWDDDRPTFILEDGNYLSTNRSIPVLIGEEWCIFK